MWQWQQNVRLVCWTCPSHKKLQTPSRCYWHTYMYTCAHLHTHIQTHPHLSCRKKKEHKTLLLQFSGLNTWAWIIVKGAMFMQDSFQKWKVCYEQLHQTLHSFTLQLYHFFVLITTKCLVKPKESKCIITSNICMIPVRSKLLFMPLYVSE